MIDSAPGTFLVLLFVTYFLSLMVTVAGQSGQCGPAPVPNYSYDFTAFGQRIVSGTDASRYTVSPCENAADCFNGTYASAVCMRPSISYYSIGLSNAKTWSYINNDPAQGVQLYVTGEQSNVPTCYSNAPSSSTVNFVCVSYPGDDSIVINQYGFANKGECQWIFTVNSKVVCVDADRSNSSTGGGGGGSGSGSSSGGGNGGDGQLIIVLLIIIILLLFCIVTNGVGLT